MIRKRLLSLLVLLAAVVTGAVAQDQWDSGDCTVTLSEGVLTVSGTGAMADYENYNKTYWYGYLSDIETIVIESGVTSIGNYAFYGCSNLESVSIPASVTSIGNYAFVGCGSNATALTVSFAEGSTPLTIGENAFAYSYLKSIDIPNRVTSIGDYAFSSCTYLESVSIPASVTSIGTYAFSYCSKLAKVSIYAPSLTTYGTNAFRNNAAGRKIYVLPEAVDTYKDGWLAYAADIEAMTVYATSVKEGTEDAGNWSATPSQATEGQTVTINYAGTKSVKSVTAKRKATTGNIMVYFTDAMNWGDVHVYYWSGGLWPGIPMTYVETNEYSQKIYRAEIPATAVGIIFNNNNNRQTVDITENIADGSWWYTNEGTDGSGHNYVSYNNKYTENIEVTNVDDNKWTFTQPDGNVELDIEYYPAYSVTISDGDVETANWSATPTEQSVGQKVTLQYTGRKKIKRITIVAAPTAIPVDLSTVTEAYTASDGETLTGTLGANVKISIADGATVTLDGVSINATGAWTSGEYAGITCVGNATIILNGTNAVTGFDGIYPGIYVPVGSTVTIKGSGSLTASGNGGGAGIGGGWAIACGNIEIQGGTITAAGGNESAGIGGGNNANCGNITISGGTITATGGDYAAGIGSGASSEASCGSITISGGTVTATGSKWAAGIGSGAFGSSCGAITITSGVTHVTATKGEEAPNSIGAGDLGSSCGTVSIEDPSKVTEN